MIGVVEYWDYLSRVSLGSASVARKKILGGRRGNSMRMRFKDRPVRGKSSLKKDRRNTTRTTTESESGYGGSGRGWGWFAREWGYNCESKRTYIVSRSKWKNLSVNKQTDDAPKTWLCFTPSLSLLDWSTKPLFGTFWSDFKNHCLLNGGQDFLGVRCGNTMTGFPEELKNVCVEFTVHVSSFKLILHFMDCLLLYMVPLWAVLLLGRPAKSKPFYVSSQQSPNCKAANSIGLCVSSSWNGNCSLIRNSGRQTVAHNSVPRPWSRNVKCYKTNKDLNKSAMT